MKIIRREFLFLSGITVAVPAMSKFARAQTQAGPKLTQVLRKDLENQGQLVQETVVSVVEFGPGTPRAALVLDRKNSPPFSPPPPPFLRFPIGDRRGPRIRASVNKRPVTRAQALTNATLAAAGLLHRRSPTAPCSKGALAAHRRKLAAFSALGGDCGSQRGPGSVIILRTISRSAFTNAIRRFGSSPLRACAGALGGGLEAGLDVLAFCFRRFMLFTIR